MNRPTGIRALLLIAKLGLRRLRNVFAIATPDKWRGIAQRRGIGILLSTLLLLMLLFHIGFYGWQISQRLMAQAYKSDGELVLTDSEAKAIRHSRLEEAGFDPTQWQARAKKGIPDGDSAALLQAYEHLLRNFQRDYEHFVADLEREIDDDPQYENDAGDLNAAGAMRRDAILAQLAAHGEESLLVEEELSWIHSDGWSTADSYFAMTLLIGFVAALFMALGHAMTDLGKVNWSFQWLYSFPVSARTLVFAKVFEYTFINIYGWTIFTPLMFAYYFVFDPTWRGVVGGALGTLYLCVAYAGLRMLVETILRRRFPLNRIKTLQAIFSLSGVLGLYSVMALGLPQIRWNWLSYFNPAELEFLRFLPSSIPIVLSHCGLWQVAIYAVAIPSTMLLFAWASSFFLRHGLVAHSNHHLAGKREALTEGGAPRRPLTVVGKDVKRLLRDQNFFMVTLIFPLVFIGFQVLLSSAALQKLGGASGLGAALAFAVCSFSLINATMSSVVSEGEALWLNYTFPQSLAKTFLQRTKLWAGIFSAYAVVIAVVASYFTDTLGLACIAPIVFAALGIVAYAYIGTGFGMSASNVGKEVSPNRRLKVGQVYMFMLLAAQYGYALYSGEIWTMTVALFLAALIAVAVWQRAEIQTPYLLDPESAPRPQLDLLDALIGVLLFFILQAIVVTVATAAQATPGLALLIGYSTGGVLALLAAAGLLRLRGVTAWRMPQRSNSTAPFATCALGLASGGVAVGYLALLHYLPFLDLPASTQPEVPFGVLLPLLVVLAPLAEEPLFRGLTHRALRKRWGRKPAIVVGALLFAICHPPISFVPVFVLGIATALSYERHGRLLPCMLIHALHNACVLLAPLYLPALR